MRFALLACAAAAIAFCAPSLAASVESTTAPVAVATRSDPAVARAVAEAVAEFPAPPERDRAASSAAVTRTLAGPGRCSTLDMVAKVALFAACVRTNCTSIVAQQGAAPATPTCSLRKSQS